MIWMSMFGKEIGSINENLVLATAGKIKIRFGKKYIDLLDNNGNLNIKIPKILRSANSISDITENGLYIVDGNFYVYYDGNVIQVTDKEAIEDYIKYGSEQFLTQEQISIAQKNIGLTFDSIDQAMSQINEGIVFIENKIYYIKEGQYSEMFLLEEPLSSISKLNTPSINNSAILYQDKKWQYIPIVTSEEFLKYKKEIFDELSSNVVQEDDEDLTSFDYIQYSKLYILKSFDLRINKNTNIYSCSEVEFQTTPEHDLTDEDICLINLKGFQCEIIINSEGETTVNPIETILTKILEFPISDFQDSSGNFKEEYIQDKMETLNADNYEIVGDIVKFTITEKRIIEETIIFNLKYKNDKLYFINEQLKEVVYDIQEYFYQNKEVYIIDNIAFYKDSFIGKYLYVKVEQSNPNKFKIDYQNSEIALEENYPDSINPHTVLGDLDNTSKYYNIDSFRTYKNKSWNQGLYSDQPVFSGAEFREPLKGSINGAEDYPRYSSNMNSDLCSNHIEVVNGNSFEKVIPSIGWIKKYFEEIYYFNTEPKILFTGYIRHISGKDYRIVGNYLGGSKYFNTSEQIVQVDNGVIKFNINLRSGYSMVVNTTIANQVSSGAIPRYDTSVKSGKGVGAHWLGCDISSGGTIWVYEMHGNGDSWESSNWNTSTNDEDPAINLAYVLVTGYLIKNSAYNNFSETQSGVLIHSPEDNSFMER